MKASEPPEGSSHPVIGAVASRDRLAILDAMLDLLAERVVVAKPYETAQITGRMQSLAKERAELAQVKHPKATVADDLARRRKARLAAADKPAPAVGGNGK